MHRASNSILTNQSVKDEKRRKTSEFLEKRFKQKYLKKSLKISAVLKLWENNI